MFLRIVLMSFALAGCGVSDESAHNHGYGFAFDVQGVTGLKVRYDPEELRQGFLQTPTDVFEAQYFEVEECTGLTAPAPFVIVVSEDALGDRGGFYYSDPPLITIKGLFIFKHEAIHYLMDYNTGDLDSNHSSPLWAKCAPLI